MTIPKFVVTAGADGLNALMDLDIDGQLDGHPLAGVKGTFTPNLKPGLYPVGGDFYPINDGLYLVEPIDFTIDTNGKLNGDSGVELLAAVDGVGNLQWTISFDRFYLNGKRQDIPEWHFNAREAGETVPLESLVSVKQGPAKWLGIGPHGPSFSGASFNGEGNLLLENADGSTLPPIPVPNGFVVLIDNGDGTWSVGG